MGDAMTASRIAMLVGSLRKESLTMKIAHELRALAPASLALENVGFGDLPLYNQDLEDSGSPPAQWTEFRRMLGTFDGFLFVTPEYNRSVPGGLKNALDVGSRPHGKSIWDGKPGAVVSVSPGSIGGFGANHHLRQILVFLNVPCMQQPEAYVGGAKALFDAQGRLVNEKTIDFLKQFMNEFAKWVMKNPARKGP